MVLPSTKKSLKFYAAPDHFPLSVGSFRSLAAGIQEKMGSTFYDTVAQGGLVVSWTPGLDPGVTVLPDHIPLALLKNPE